MKRHGELLLVVVVVVVWRALAMLRGEQGRVGGLGGRVGGAGIGEKR